MADTLKTPTKKTDKITTYFSPDVQKSSRKDKHTEKSDLSSPFLTPTSTPPKHNESKKDASRRPSAKVVIDLASEKLNAETIPSATEPYSDTVKESAKTAVKKGRSGVRKQKKKITTPSQPRAKTAKQKPAEPVNHMVTDYFPVRRSVRRTRNEVKKDKETELREAILSGCEEGLKVVDIEGKGRGVVASKPFGRGDFVVEYAGDLISVTEAKERELQYSQDSDIGCYMYYFNFRNKNYCIDATAESGKLGRLLNHSTKGNCTTKLVGVDDRPYLILVAAKDIASGDELLYDYGDRSKSSIESHPWLKL